MPTISLIFAAAAVLLNIWLGIRCGQRRTAAKVNHGDGGDVLLARRMRAQLNFAENAPLTLLLFLILELTGASATFLWVMAGAFLLARVLHPIGMDAEKGHPARMVRTVLTLLVQVILAGYALYSGYQLLQLTDLPASIAGSA